jgi:hypothetical protein
VNIKELEKKIRYNSDCINNLGEQLKSQNNLTSARDLTTSRQIERLIPLAELIELIPIIKEIAEDRKATTRVTKIVMKIIGVIGAIIGLVYGAIILWKEVK